MGCKNIEQLRKLLTEKLIEYKESGEKDHIKLDIDKKIFEQILFENKKIAIPDNLWKLLDLSGVSFDGINVMGVDFTGSKGVVIDPQTVHDKDLRNTKLAGVEIKGSFDGVCVYSTDFTGSKGGVLNPQKVEGKNLRNAKLAGVEIKGSLDGVKLGGTDFTGSKGVIKLNPQKVYGNDLSYAKLAGVEIKGSLDGVKLGGTDFTGSKGAKMYFEEAEVARELGSDLTDVKIINNDEYKEIIDKIEKAFQPQLKLE